MNSKSVYSVFSHSLTAALTLFGLAAYPSGALANWNQTATGTYEYTDSANWSSGNINGIFSNAIAGAQTITFDENWALTTYALRMNYTTPHDLVFRSDSATARTLTFANNASFIGVASNDQGNSTGMRTITFGTASNPLIFDLGAGAFNHTIRPGQNTNFLVNAKITGGNAGNYLLIEGKTSNGGYIELTNSESDFISNISITVARPLRVSSVADAGEASAIGAGTIIRFNNGSRADFIYTGAAASTNRNVVQGTSSAGGIYIFNEGSGKLTFTGDFLREASSSVELRFAGSQDIEVTGAIADSAGAGTQRVSKYGSASTLTLTNANSAFSGSLEVRQGTVEFTSVGNTDVNSSLGSGSKIDLGAASAASDSLGTLRYLGSADASTNRELVLNQAAIHNDGVGSLAFTGTVTVAGDGARTLFLGGSNEGNNRITGIIGDGSGSTPVRSLVKEGSGRWILEGDNTYSGTTLVSEGTLLIQGEQTGTGLVTVSDGAAIGGGGSIAGGLTLGSGADFVFSLTETLTVAGNVSIHSSFGVENLLGLDSSTALGVYTLIDGTTTDFASLGIENWGIDQAYNLGEGKIAYFQQGSLQLVVAVPEPGTAGLFGVAALFVAWRCRRRSIRA